MRVFRLHRAPRPAADYSGSLPFPGRWNTSRTGILYAAESLALSCLETLVHLRPDDTPPAYVYSFADLALDLEVADFRGDLRNIDTTQRFGHRWAVGQQALALRVPSVIVPIEYNVLLNPLHQDFDTVAWSGPTTFQFDPRLVRRLLN